MKPNKKHKTDIIREQVSRILSAQAFTRSKILSDFLKFIVKETLAGRADGLKEYLIAIEVLGRKKDFDPKLDSVVRIHAGRLRRALSEYYHGTGAHDPIRIDVPKGAYIPVFSENTSTLNSTAQRERAKPDKDQTSLVTKPVVAVLPLQNLSDDPAQDFFAQGLSVQLSIELGRFQELDVIGFPSPHHLATTMTDDLSIGMALKADYLVTGCVRRTHNQVRIQVGLQRTDSGVQLWSQYYDKKLDSQQLFEVEDEIVHRVTSIIGGNYGVIIRDRAKTIHPHQGNGMETIDAVLWYHKYQLNHTPESYQQARLALEKAVEIAPDYALAWGVLGELYISALLMGYASEKGQVAKAMDCARKAVQLDPREPAGYEALAAVHLVLKQREELIESAETCLAANPHSSMSHGAMGFILVCAGLYERGMKHFMESTRLNPYYPWWFNVGPFLFHYRNGAYKAALKYAEKMNKPDTFWMPLFQSAALGRLERPADCEKVLEALRRLDPDISRNARKFLTALLIPEDLVAELMTGLQMAGLEWE